MDEAESPPATDDAVVAHLLGRAPMGAFTVVVRRHDGSPVVIENQPVFDSGRPMPTRYWLCDRAINRAIGRLEAEQGVKRAERELAADAIAATHALHAAARDRLLPSDHQGPRPSGGVGGTRQGVKCLHAHYANFLVDGIDVVGAWVEHELHLVGAAFDPSEPGIVSAWPPASEEHDR